MLDTIEKFINALGKPAIFDDQEEGMHGYITEVSIHKVDGVTNVFIGGNPEPQEGITRDFFNPHEVTILE